MALQHASFLILCEHEKDNVQLGFCPPAADQSISFPSD